MKVKGITIDQLKEDLLVLSNLSRKAGDYELKDLITEDINSVLWYHGVKGLSEVITYVIQNVRQYDLHRLHLNNVQCNIEMLKGEKRRL